MSDQRDASIPKDSFELYAACRSAESPIRDAAYEQLWRDLCRVALQVVRDQREADALAQDCGQEAIHRVHQRLAECREPERFLSWARSIVKNIAIDELRRRKRLVPLDDTDDILPPDPSPSPEARAFENVSNAELRQLIHRAPISERSRRVILGALDNIPDEQLAQVESDQSHSPVRPSNVQVIRSRDIVRLRKFLEL